MKDHSHADLALMHAQEFVDMLALKPDERVLDVGCGIGARPAPAQNGQPCVPFQRWTCQCRPGWERRQVV